MNKPSWCRQLAVLGTTATLLLTALPAYVQAGTPSSEQLQQTQQEQEQEGDHWRFGGDREGHGHNREGREARKLEFMKEAAQYFSISTQGKTAEQLEKELVTARKENPAKWEKFKAEKKSQHLARLQETAKRLGISTEGKTSRQLQQEIREKCNNRTIKQNQDKPSVNDAKTHS